jgi:hypothetical protein
VRVAGPITGRLTIIVRSASGPLRRKRLNTDALGRAVYSFTAPAPTNGTGMQRVEVIAIVNGELAHTTFLVEAASRVR